MLVIPTGPESSTAVVKPSSIVFISRSAMRRPIAIFPTSPGILIIVASRTWLIARLIAIVTVVPLVAILVGKTAPSSLVLGISIIHTLLIHMSAWRRATFPLVLLCW